MSDVELNQNQENENQVDDFNETHEFEEVGQDKNENDENNSRYQHGQLLTFVRVRFPGVAKSHPFVVGKRKFGYGEKVIALSDRGMAMGYINSFPYEVPFDESLLPIRSITKKATDDDFKDEQHNKAKESQAEELCKKLIEKHNLDMELTHVEFTQYGKKAVFFFTAPARVDFRNLVRDLVADLKMRIELRQISIRDRASSLGGIGPCGLQLCCSSFLSQYGNVNIKLAKNQNLSLNPTRLNGLCGQLKCCLVYEDDVYVEKRNRLPQEQTLIQTKNGDKGKVIRLHILIEQFEMLTHEGKIKKYAQNQFIGDNNFPKNIKFPENFEHIVVETDKIIGLTQEPAYDNSKLKSSSYELDELDNQIEQFLDEEEDDIDGQNFEDGEEE